jgi:hypothetical protein
MKLVATRLFVVSALLNVILSAGAYSAGTQLKDSTASNQAGANESQGGQHAPIIVQVVPAKKTAEEAEAERLEREAKAESDAKLVDFTGKLANYTLGLFVATGILCLVTAWLGALAWRQSIDTRRSIKIAEDTLIASNRPWLQLDARISSDLTFENGEGRISFLIEVLNHGKAPAVGMSISAGVNAYPKEEQIEGKPGAQPLMVRADPARELHRSCKVIAEARQRWREAGSNLGVEDTAGHTIFPGNHASGTYTLTLAKKDIDAAIALGGGRFTAVLLASVEYQFPFHKNWGQTGIAYQVLCFDANAPGHRMQIDPARGNIPADKLRLDRTGFGGSLAS